jgi:flagellar basal-body rod protein FlgC
MDMFRIFNIAGSGMTAQSIRLNTIASNLANANNVSGDPNKVYKAKVPVFSAVFSNINQQYSVSRGVKVDRILESKAPAIKLYDPGNPLADKQGYVYKANVNPVNEMASMMSASRSFQNNVEVLNTLKQLMTATIRLGE